jgi:hypothetical protein
MELLLPILILVLVAMLAQAAGTDSRDLNASAPSF